MSDDAGDNKSNDASTIAARVTISEKDFVLRFRPVKNHIRADADFEGYMFEPDGRELEFVVQQAAGTIWTLLEDLEGGAVLVSGFHADHSMGHFACRTPVPEGAEIEVDIHRDENMT